MKEITWDNPNKMHIESDWVLFNKQTNCITTGNVYANTQSSSYIRPFCETICGGITRNPGELMEFDLKYFEAPYFIKNWIREKMKNRKESCIAYNFHVYHGEIREDFGFVLTDNNHHLIDYKVLDHYGTRLNMNKRYSAIKAAIEYITEE